MLEAIAPLPPLAYQDYRVDLHLRIYLSGARYGADIFVEGQCARVAVDMSPQDLVSLNQRMQEEVQALALDAAAVTGSPAAAADRHLDSLAELGHYAFRKVFGGDMGAQLQELLTRQPCSLQVASEEFFLPWELLYPTPMDRRPSYDNFLGLSHVVSRVIVQEGHRGAFVPSAIPAAVPPKLGLLTYGGLPGVLGKELAFFDRLATEGKIRLHKLAALDPGRKKEELKQFRQFWKEALNLAHLACEAIYDEKFPPDSHLLFSDDFPVTLKDLEVSNILIDSHPLIVLNACQTGSMNPLYTPHFAAFAAAFLRCGARGVVATECLVPDAFAADFVQGLYLRLLAGRPLGESMLDTRRFFAQQGNPSGLLYSLYASPSIRLVRQDLVPGQAGA